MPLRTAVLVPTLLVAGLCASVCQATTAAQYGGCAGTVPERIADADPSNYRALLDTLGPGDLLRLAPGTYTQGLPFVDHHGEPDRCIVVEGPESGPAAVFTGCNCRNTVSLTDSSYLVVRNLELDGLGLAGDGVKAESPSASVHHVTIENLYIHGHGAGQQIVGINTKCRAWNWVVRRNVIEAAGTGMYFGDSNGEAEFVHSLIEHNLVYDTVGYNIQVKHQNGRATGLGIPASGTTIIRHNVFSKANNASSGYDARPNLLVGHWPTAGAGSNDDYLIYGNFFHQNPSEALFQGEGNVIFYDNLLANDFGAAVRIQPHNDVPKRIRIYYNTLVANGTTVSISGGDPGFEQLVVGNALFGNAPTGGAQTDNVVDTYANAVNYLVNPDGVLTGAVDRLDFYPLVGLAGPVDTTGLSGYTDWDVDFNGTPRATSYRGAYVGGGSNPGWLPARERKPETATAFFAENFELGGFSRWSVVLP